MWNGEYFDAWRKSLAQTFSTSSVPAWGTGVAAGAVTGSTQRHRAAPEPSGQASFCS